MERVTSSTSAQVLARRRNWYMRNLVGWLSQLRGGFVSMSPEDDADVQLAIEALSRVDARRKARYEAKWVICAPCAGGGWIGELSGHECAACKGQGRVRAPKARKASPKAAS